MIDTHCHIYEPEYEADIDQVIERFKNVGGAGIVLANVNAESIPQIDALYRKYPQFARTSIGLHPEDVKLDYKEQLAKIEQYISDDTTAIGEVGIDLYFSDEFREQQIEALKVQIDWAKMRSLPLLIHARKGFAEIFQVMKHEKNLRGIFHCFGGGIEEAKKAISMGFYLGVGGIVTFKKSALPELLSQIGPEQIVLETDAPYLAPVPVRGTRNEPYNLIYVRARLAEIFGTTEEEIDRITTRNAENLFGKFQ